MYPPPIFVPPSRNGSDPNFSPLVIALIGILASAFLLVSYYTIIAKYCTKWEAFRPRTGGEADHNRIDPFPVNESWPLMTRGLDEDVIRSIPVFKYEAGDGMIDDSECAVCLSEFQQDENLRLLPKCSHAFHVPCIDMWLTSHSNCPLCRANIVNPVVSPAIEGEESVGEENSESTVDYAFQEQSESEGVRESSEEESGHGIILEAPGLLPISHTRAQSELMIKHGRNESISQSTRLFLSEMQQCSGMRRSFSVDSSRRLAVSITDLLALHQAIEDGKLKGHGSANEQRADASGSIDLEHGKSQALCTVDEAQVGSSSSVQSSNPVEEQNLAIEMPCVSSKALNKQCDVDRNKSAMKRSFSGGRFFFMRNSRGRNGPILPA